MPQTLKCLEFLPEESVGVYSRKKTKTFRLGDRSGDFMPGDNVSLVVTGGPEIAQGRISTVTVKNFGDIDVEDLAGTGLKYLNALFDALESIYINSLQRISKFSSDTVMSVIEWKYR